MAKSRNLSSRKTPNGNFSQRELIVVAKNAANLMASRSESLASVMGSEIADLVQKNGATISPLFSSAHASNELSGAAKEVSNYLPEQFCHVLADEEKLDEIANALMQGGMVETAYVKPRTEAAMATEVAAEVEESLAEEELGINDMTPRLEDSPPVSPNFESRQLYLNPAPAGVDARYSWTLPGGSGQGVRIIDIEWGWNFTHEDLLQNQAGVIAGNNSPNNDHGTAVIGEIGGDRNSFGITGISPDATVQAISLTTIPTAQAITMAADRLNPGDVILLEVHRAGPRFNFQARQDQKGYIAIEWWMDDFLAIRYATNKGIIVVEAAGNGAENFDTPIYDQRPAGFPANWRNPLNPANPSSGAIVVGAGAPPSGNFGTDRSRLDFSNYGRRVDCQGWGREVTTTGYGDLQGGNRNTWYTTRFSGTSSASPIVVGTIACLQGILKARAQAPLTPANAIQLLRTTGSPQTDTVGRPASQRIGNRPNLRELISRLTPSGIRTVALYRYWNSRIGDHFYTTNWRELGSGRYGWRYEGIQCRILPSRSQGAIPLYRYWNPGIGDHFYTTNWRELGSGRYGWRYEGIQGYVMNRRVARSLPLYRYWNSRIGDHFYTTNWQELGGGRYGWRYEGIQCYVFPVTVQTYTPSADTDELGAAPHFESATEEGASLSFAPEFAEAQTFQQQPNVGDFAGKLDFTLPNLDLNVPSNERDDAIQGSFEVQQDVDSINTVANGQNSFQLESADQNVIASEGSQQSPSFTVEQDENQRQIVLNINLGPSK